MNIHHEEDITQTKDVKILKRLFPYLKKQSGKFILCLILVALTTGADLLLPYMMKVAIDDSLAAVETPVRKLEDVHADAAFIEGSYYIKELKEGPGKRLLGDEGEIPAATGPEYTIKERDGERYLTGPGLDVLLTKEQYLQLRSRDFSLLSRIALLVVILLGFNFVFGFLNVYVLHNASQKIIYSLRSNLFAHIQKLPLSFFDKNPVGRLVTRVTNDMKNISQFFTDVLVTVIKDIALIGGTVAVILSMDLTLGIAGLLTFPFVILISSVFRVKARKVQRAVKVKLARINSYLSESINGMKIIQVFNREKLSFKEFDEQNRDYLKSSIDETRVYAVFRPGMHLMYAVSLALVVGYGGFRALEGDVELGILVAFFQYIHHLFRPISDLAEKFNIFQSSMASSERIFMLFDETSHIKEVESPVTLAECKGNIRFNNVDFSYIPGQPILKNINLDIKAGETIALVGATGSGKTTITSMVSRFYDPDQGSITLDGVDIRELSLDSLRSRISIVLQDVFLFSGDIKGNIGLNNDDISYERIIDSAKYVNAHKFISRLEDGYDHEVKERGASFSAGERQLLSFARALAFDPEILILDEATSSIDTETEHLIQEAISRLIQNRTTIIVAHRLSTIKNADKIVVLHKGEVREIGKHEELLEKKGMYYDLYRLQVAGV